MIDTGRRVVTVLLALGRLPALEKRVKSLDGDLATAESRIAEFNLDAETVGRRNRTAASGNEAS